MNDESAPFIKFESCHEKCPEDCVNNNAWKHILGDSDKYNVDVTLKIQCNKGIIKCP